MKIIFSFICISIFLFGCQSSTLQSKKNTLELQNNWLQVELVDHTRSIAAAQVLMSSGDWSQVQSVDGGHGRNGKQRDHILHFGLGALCQVNVVVRWSDGESSTHEVNQVNQRVSIERPDGL